MYLSLPIKRQNWVRSADIVDVMWTAMASGPRWSCVTCGSLQARGLKPLGKPTPTIKSPGPNGSADCNLGYLYGTAVEYEPSLWQ